MSLLSMLLLLGVGLMVIDGVFGLKNGENDGSELVSRRRRKTPGLDMNNDYEAMIESGTVENVDGSVNGDNNKLLVMNIVREVSSKPMRKFTEIEEMLATYSNSDLNSNTIRLGSVNNNNNLNTTITFMPSQVVTFDDLQKNNYSKLIININGGDFNVQSQFSDIKRYMSEYENTNMGASKRLLITGGSANYNIQNGFSSSFMKLEGFEELKKDGSDFLKWQLLSNNDNNINNNVMIDDIVIVDEKNTLVYGLPKRYRFVNRNIAVLSFVIDSDSDSDLTVVARTGLGHPAIVLKNTAAGFIVFSAFPLSEIGDDASDNYYVRTLLRNFLFRSCRNRASIEAQNEVPLQQQKEQLNIANFSGFETIQIQVKDNLDLNTNLIISHSQIISIVSMLLTMGGIAMLAFNRRKNTISILPIHSPDAFRSRRSFF